MKIITKQADSSKNLNCLLKKTLLIILIIIVVFLVIAKSGEFIRDFLFDNIYNTFLNIEDSNIKLNLKSLYYYSAVYDLSGICHDKYIKMELGKDNVYKVEFILKDESNYIIISAQNTTYDKYIYLIPEYIKNKGFERIKITPIKGAAGFWVKNLETHEDIDLNEYDDFEIVDFEIKQISIDIKLEDLEQLAQHRANARARFLLLDEDCEYYPASISSTEKISDIQIRLKGDWTDHLNSEKWSFRIKINDDCLWGMKEFSLHMPEARRSMGEYLIQDFHSQQGGVSLKYDFGQVIINDEYWGVYAIEEAFDKRVIESSFKREGPIVKMDESYMWERKAYYNAGMMKYLDYSNLDIFSFNKTMSNQKLFEYSQYAIDLLYRALNSEILPQEVFDIDAYAKYLAISDLFMSSHGSIWHNQRFYFNPITAKLEPITFDEEYYYDDYEPSSQRGGFIKELFKNDEFLNLYIAYLNEYISNYDEYYKSKSAEIEKYSYLFKTDDVVDYNFEEEISIHHKMILETLKKESAAFKPSIDKNGDIIIDIINNGFSFINVKKVLYDNNEIDYDFSDNILGIIIDSKLFDKQIDEEILSKFEIEYIAVNNQKSFIKKLDLSEFSGSDN